LLLWIVLLMAVVAIAVLIWNYRRQVAAREAASTARMKALIEQVRGNPVVNPAPTIPAMAAKVTPAVSAKATPAPVAQAHAVVVSGILARASLLSAEQVALFQALQSALPEYGVFPRMSLSAFIRPADNLTGFAREVQQRRLTDAVVDFLVCDKGLRPVAAVRVEDAGDAAWHALAQSCIQSTGLRYVALDSEAVPKAEEIRARVLGV
jgi:hypothetical protein